MRRNILYPGAIPLSTDGGNIQRNTMVALGVLAQSVFGTGSIVDGLALSSTSIPSMTVNVGPGMITQLAVVDQNAFGSLPADTTDPLLKFGINISSVPFTLVAPTTSGQSINYLIEASFQEADGTPIVLPFYNAANPAQAYAGPAGGGAASNTIRDQTVSLQLKAGASATTGTQTTPAVDSGWVGLYVITVNYGQTQITSASWQTVSNAPFIQTKLSAMRTICTGPLNLHVATTGNDANDGLSAAYPKATIQGAVNALYTRYDLAGYPPTIYLAAGTYANAYVQGLPVGAAQSGAPVLSIIGNTAAPSSVVINGTTASAITASGASLFLNGVTLESSYSGGCGMAAQSGANVTIGGAVVFGACTIAQMQANSAAFISATAGYSITGGGQNHLLANGGDIQVIGGTVTISGTPNYSQSFALAEGGGNIVSYNTVWSGSATGVKFQASALGAFEVAGSGVNYFPGNSAGIVGSVGSYG